jgi:hypothetical protein
MPQLFEGLPNLVPGAIGPRGASGKDRCGRSGAV